MRDAATQYDAAQPDGAYPGLEACFAACSAWDGCRGVEERSTICFLRHDEGNTQYPTGFKYRWGGGSGIGPITQGNGNSGATCYVKGK